MDFLYQRRPKVLIAGEPMFLPGKQSALPVLDDRQGAKAIVLNLIDPVPVIEGFWLLNQRHRLWNDHETVYQPLWSVCLASEECVERHQYSQGKLMH